MGNPSFESMYLLLENGGFAACYVSLPKGTSFGTHGPPFFRLHPKGWRGLPTAPNSHRKAKDDDRDEHKGGPRIWEPPWSCVFCWSLPDPFKCQKLRCRQNALA